MKGLKLEATKQAIESDRQKEYKQWLKEVIVETEIRIRKDIEQKITI